MRLIFKRILRLERLIVKIGKIALAGTGSMHHKIHAELNILESELREIDDQV